MLAIPRFPAVPEPQPVRNPEPTGFCYWTGWSEWTNENCFDKTYRSCQTNTGDNSCCEGDKFKSRTDLNIFIKKYF